MRRLNLLRQIMAGQNISEALGLSASTRHLLTTLNLLNSQRRWPDELEVSSRTLLEAAGYKPSRYAKGLVQQFNRDLAASGLADVRTDAHSTTYVLRALTKDDVDYAKRYRADSMAVNRADSMAGDETRSAPSPALSTMEGSGKYGNTGNIESDRRAATDVTISGNYVERAASDVLADLAKLGV